MAAAASSSDDESNQNPIAADSYTLCSFVDEVESRTEMLRRQATSLVGEKASLLLIMEQLKHDCMRSDMSSEDYQELLANMERLKARIEAVQIHVNTVRDEGQVLALDKVNAALQDLHSRLYSEDSGRKAAVKQAHTYLNACLPETDGAVDSRFQSMVLGCALDDQKEVRRRLETLVRDCSRRAVSNASNSACERMGPASSELSNNAAVSSQSTNVKESLPGSQPAPEKEKGANDEENDSIQNHLREEWFSAPKDSKDSSDLSVTQQEGETIQQLHAEGDNRGHNQGDKHHSDGVRNS